MPAFNKGQVLAIHFHPVRRARTCLKQKGNRAKVTVREVSIIVGLALCIAPMKSVDGERQRPVIRVSLDVSASDDLRGVITSYLARELRKIDDVTVSDTRPLFRIECVALKVRNQAGYPMGYTLSFATTSMMPSAFTTLIAASKLSKEDADALATWNSNRGVLVDHFVQTCASDELQGVCRQLVAKFDGDLIESARQFAQKYVESVQSAAPEDDLRAAPSAAPLPGVSFETVDEQKKDTQSFSGENYPQIRTRLLTSAEVSVLTPSQIRDAINEVYARHGFYFGDSKTRQAFEKLPWYHPNRKLSHAQIEAELSEIEAANVKALGKAREALH